MLSRLALDAPQYPERLRRLPDPPAGVVVRGSLPVAPSAPVVAIIGSRRASAEGTRIAEGLARRLAQAGIIVVSGGALGIDAAAHRGALAGAGLTWVVLPTTVERPVPSRNRPLFGEIVASGGALLADAVVAPGKLPFLRRNRLIAALVDRVVVVEAAAESGTRHTVEAAQKLGVPVNFWRWPADDPRGDGARAPWGAGGTLVDGPGLVLEALGPQQGELGPPDGPLLGALAPGPQTLDALARALGWPTHRVLAELSTLELAGRVLQRGGRYTTR